METAPSTQTTEWRIYKTFKSIVDFEIDFSLKKSLREIGIVFDVTDQGLTMLYNTGRIKTFKVNSSINSGSVVWWIRTTMNLKSSHHSLKCTSQRTKKSLVGQLSNILTIKKKYRLKNDINLKYVLIKKQLIRI